MSKKTDELTEFMRLLDVGSNLWGELKPDIRTRLYNVVDRPSQRTWGDAYSIILTASPRWVTLWQALLAYTDYRVTRGPADGERWTAIPTREQLMQALRGVLG